MMDCHRGELKIEMMKTVQTMQKHKRFKVEDDSPQLIECKLTTMNSKMSPIRNGCCRSRGRSVDQRERRRLINSAGKFQSEVHFLSSFRELRTCARRDHLDEIEIEREREREAGSLVLLIQPEVLIGLPTFESANSLRH